MLKTLAIVLIVALVALLAYAATRPDSFRVQRETLIKAPADRVFALLNDFKQWPQWSPWEKLDPAMTRTHSGAANGVGAAYAWQGNKKVGEGAMEITQATPPKALTIKLDFIKPFEGHNITEFTIEPQGDQVKLRWDMHGPSTFITKLMGVFFSMDKMIGKDFEAGLANLKAAAER
jgi:uncharacterized protein YndB with AHSA1/START domain